MLVMVVAFGKGLGAPFRVEQDPSTFDDNSKCAECDMWRSNGVLPWVLEYPDPYENRRGKQRARIGRIVWREAHMIATFTSTLDHILALTLFTVEVVSNAGAESQMDTYGQGHW